MKGSPGGRPATRDQKSRNLRKITIALIRNNSPPNQKPCLHLNIFHRGKDEATGEEKKGKTVYDIVAQKLMRPGGLIVGFKEGSGASPHQGRGRWGRKKETVKLGRRERGDCILPADRARLSSCPEKRIARLKEKNEENKAKGRRESPGANGL